jgi:hypothetical protein
MVRPFKDNEIVENLKLLADWLQVKYPGEPFELIVAGGAATPSYRKHTEDLSNLRPSKRQITEALRFVMSIDDSDPRKDDLRIVMKELGFEFDEIHHNPAKKGKPRR